MKKVYGGEVISRGRKLSLSRVVRAGDMIYVTGQLPLVDGVAVTDGTIEEQTRVVCERLKENLALAGCELADVVKAMVWLQDPQDFEGFNSAFGEYFPEDPPARSAVVSKLLQDVRVEVEVVAYRPE